MLCTDFVIITTDVPDSNFLIGAEPDSTGYQANYLTGTATGYLNTCCIALFGFLCDVNKKSIISQACCFQFCVNLHRSTTIKKFVYITHSLQEYKSQ